MSATAQAAFGIGVVLAACLVTHLVPRTAVLGAVLLGIIETMTSAYLSSTWRDLIAFGLLIFILVVRPSGLMGKNNEDKA